MIEISLLDLYMKDDYSDEDVIDLYKRCGFELDLDKLDYIEPVVSIDDSKDVVIMSTRDMTLLSNIGIYFSLLYGFAERILNIYDLSCDFIDYYLPNVESSYYLHENIDFVSRYFTESYEDVMSGSNLVYNPRAKMLYASLCNVLLLSGCSNMINIFGQENFDDGFIYVRKEVFPSSILDVKASLGRDIYIEMVKCRSIIRQSFVSLGGVISSSPIRLDYIKARGILPVILFSHDYRYSSLLNNHVTYKDVVLSFTRKLALKLWGQDKYRKRDYNADEDIIEKIRESMINIIYLSEKVQSRISESSKVENSQPSGAGSEVVLDNSGRDHDDIRPEDVKTASNNDLFQ